MQLELRIYLFFLLIERRTAIITTTNYQKDAEAMRTMVIVLLSVFFVSSLTGALPPGGFRCGVGFPPSFPEGFRFPVFSVSLSVSVSVVVSEPLSFGVGV